MDTFGNILGELDEANSFDSMGIDIVLDHDTLVSYLSPPPDQPDFNIYELRSKVPPLAESPTIKTENPKSRTQLKQLLMRDQQLHEQGKKRAEKLHQIVNNSLILNEQPQTPQMVAEKPAEPVKVPIDIRNMEVPQQVLEVTTRLQNPTMFHLREKQKHQVIQYINSDNNTLGHLFARKAEGAHSAPVQQDNKLKPKYASYTAAPSPEILSPGLNSVATSGDLSDAEELLENILSLEASVNTPGSQTQSLYRSSLSVDDSSRRKSSSSSCPPELFKQEISVYSEVDFKDRLKKDNHNVIEKRRRLNINDRIKELGELLPKNDDPHFNIVRDSRQNKGNILKSSVDYIKELKKDSRKKKLMEDENRQLLAENRKLLLRIKELEKQAKDNGLQVENSIWKVMEPENFVNTFLKNEPLPRSILNHKIPDLVCEASNVQIDDIMEEEVIMRRDPMLCSPLSSQKSSSPAGSHFYDEEMDMNPSS